MLTSAESAATLALDAVNVYWVNNVGADDLTTLEVRKMPKTGGAPVTVYASKGNSRAIVSDGDAVYFTVVRCPEPLQPCTSTLVRAAADGSGGGDLGPGIGVPAVDDESVYVTGPSRASQGTMVTDLLKQPKRGGDAAVLSSVPDGSGWALTLSGGEAYWGIWWHDSEIYGAIRAVPISGSGTERTVTSMQNLFPASVKVDGDWVFLRTQGWTNGPPANVYQAPRSGPQGPPELLWKAPNGSDVDANAQVVYWNQGSTDQFPGCLGRANANGSDARCLDQGPDDFAGVRVDDTAVYYIKNRQIWRRSK